MQNFMCRLTKFTLSSLFVILVSTSAAWAMRVSPLNIDMSTTGEGTLTVNNTQAHDITVQISFIERSPNTAGGEDSRPADDAFITFPPQGVIKSGKSQLFRIQWAGGDLKQSKSFYAKVEQLQVDWSMFGDAGSGVQIVFTFNAALHVSPGGAESDLKISDIKQKEGGVSFKVTNQGNRYDYLSQHNLVLNFDGKKETIGHEAVVKAMNNNSLIMPGATREVLMPTKQIGVPGITLE